MKFITKNKNFLVLLLIIFVGGIFRFWHLDSYPVSPNWDEVSHGYNAFSILKTGKDEWGNAFPLLFRAFGDYKLPLYIYLTIIPIAFFGLNVFAVRFISALAGTLAIFGIYLLTNTLFPKKYLSIEKYKIEIGLITAFLLAINPWHFFISRPALEANLALTLIIFGAYFLLRFFKEKSSLLPSALLLGLSLHTYNTARVFVPLLIIFTIYIYRKYILISGKYFWKNVSAILLFGFLSMLVVYQVLSGDGSARYEKLKILSPSIVFQIGEARSASTLPPFLSKLVHNRPVFFTATVLKNYSDYFSPAFFYQKWGAQFQFAVPGQNLLTLPVYLLSILGFLFITKNILNNKSNQFIFIWLLLSPIAASLTIDPPQALRPNPMIPSLIIFASIGLFFILEKTSKKYRSTIFVILSLWIISSFSLYLYKYATEYKEKYSSSWQYGYTEVINYIYENSEKYDRIFITKRYGEPHIFYAFMMGLSPEKIQPGGDNIRFAKSDWYWTDKIDNVYFINDWQIPDKTHSLSSLKMESGGEIPTQRSLLITSPEHLPVNASIIKTVNFLDGTSAFIIALIP